MFNVVSLFVADKYRMQDFQGQKFAEIQHQERKIDPASRTKELSFVGLRAFSPFLYFVRGSRTVRRNGSVTLRLQHDLSCSSHIHALMLCQAAFPYPNPKKARLFPQPISLSRPANPLRAFPAALASHACSPSLHRLNNSSTVNSLRFNPFRTKFLAVLYSKLLIHLIVSVAFSSGWSSEESKRDRSSSAAGGAKGWKADGFEVVAGMGGGDGVSVRGGGAEKADEAVVLSSKRTADVEAMGGSGAINGAAAVVSMMEVFEQTVVVFRDE